MVRKALLVCGILSSLLYAAMNIVVPMFYEGYSSASQTISELSAIGAPTRPLWVALGHVYTVLVTAFGFGVWLTARGNGRLSVVGGLLVIYGLTGIAWAFAPMHQREVLAAGGGTLSDTMHIILSGITSIIYMAVLVFGAGAFGKRFRIYSIVTLALLIVFGILLGLDGPKVSANQPTPWVGVTERVMIGVVVLWIMVLAVALLRADGKQPE
jgi:hypothetical protein